MKKSICCVLILILIASCLFTLAKYETMNAPAVAAGLLRVCLLDEPCAQIGSFPRVYLGNAENGFDVFINTMENWGYTHHPEEQMGALYWFTDAEGNWFHVLFRRNAHYSTWIWC